MTDLVQYNNFGNFKVRKYKREVFYNNLWNTDPILLESRGHVLNENDELVANPFKKVFNYKENDTIVDLDKDIVCVEKVNGFMFHVTQHQDFIIEGTTGSLSSPFTELAKQNMIKHGVNYKAFENILYNYGGPMTCIFEIKDNINDPHIIDDEQDGVYLLGVRCVSSGKLLRQDSVDSIAKELNVKRPNWEIIKFGEVLKKVNEVKHEGFVIYSLETNEALLKLKSPYYISKKSLMRKHPSKVYDNSYKTLVDEEYYPIIEKIREKIPLEQWAVMNEQRRGDAFNIVYKATLLSLGELIKYITNHPKISFNLEDDSVLVSYDYNADYYIARINLYKINLPELGLKKFNEARGVGDSLDEAIKNLYIDLFLTLGDYEYKDDFSLSKTSQIEYYNQIEMFTRKEKENLEQDIQFYCR